MLPLCHQHWVILFSGVLLQPNLSLESAKNRTDHLPLSWSAPTDRDNFHTQYWCFLVNLLDEEGNYCNKVLLIFILMHSYCINCCEQLVILESVQLVSNLWSLAKALVLIAHKIFQNNMVLDMSGNILFSVPCLFSLSYADICSAI